MLNGEDVTKAKSKNKNKQEEPGEDRGAESKESEPSPALNPTKAVALRKRGREENTKGKEGLLVPSSVRVLEETTQLQTWLLQIGPAVSLGREGSEPLLFPLARNSELRTENPDSQDTICRGRPRIAGSHQDLGERCGNDSLRTSSLNQHCRHLDLGLLASRTIQGYISVLLNHSVCGGVFVCLFCFFTAALGDQHKYHVRGGFNRALA